MFVNVCLPVRPQKSFSDLNEIWYVRRGRCVLYEGVPYDPIQGQGHGGPKFAKMADFTSADIHVGLVKRLTVEDTPLYKFVWTYF